MIEQFDFRPMAREDLPCVAALDAAATAWSWDLSHFTRSLEAGHLCRVCEWRQGTARQVVAFAIVQQVLDEVSLLNIAVAPDWQSQGLGRRMLLHVMDQCRATGARRMLLEVRASNRRAGQLYRSMGFRQDGQRRDYYPGREGREDALLFSLAFRDDRSAMP